MTSRQRQDSIVRKLRRNGTCTIAQLAEDIGASRRTVLRDIKALREDGFIIHSEPGRAGGLQLDPYSIQTTAKLNVNEVFALVISVAAARAAGTLPFANLADSGLAKIERSLPKDTVQDLRRFLNCLYIGPLAPEVNRSNVGSMDAGLLPAFEQAFLHQNRLAFNYLDAKGKLSERDVEPQAMLILPPLWYLVAWDPCREDFRHFRMDRISQPRVLADTKFMRRHLPFESGISPLSVS